MHESENNGVAELLIDIQSHSSEKYEILVQIRKLFLQSNPRLVEDIKYGGLVFFQEDHLIGGIFLYKKHISIEFSYGAELSDPHSVLEGKGKLRRHIKIINLDDVHTKNVADYVQKAVAFIPD